MSGGIKPVIGAHIAVVPKHRMEGVTFLLQRQRMTGADDLVIHELVRHRQRPIPVVDGARDLLDRPAIGADGVEDAEEVEFFDSDQIELFQRRLAENDVAHPVAQRPQRPDQDVAAGFEILDLAVAAVGDLGIARQVGLVAVVIDEPDAGDETGDDADREGAAAEAETVDFVAIPVVAAAEGIDVDDVALQAEAENAAEDGERLE